MQDSPATARLVCSVAPQTVPRSDGDDKRSIVSLTFTARNDSPEMVPCPRLRIVIPSDTIDKAGALTTDPTTFALDVGDATPWAIVTSGNGTCHAVPLPPATGIAPGGRAEFIVADIVVSSVPGPVDISIFQAGEQLPIIVQVTKDGPVGAGSGPPRIARFEVTPDQVALGAEVTIGWEVSGAQSCTLAPGPVTLPSAASGTVAVPVLNTTDFILTALGVGGAASAARTVTVQPAEITEFTSQPPGPVGPGQQVTLAWRTRFASSCSVDHGVGPVPAEGSTAVTVPATTVYTLVATGLDQQERSITVEVRD
jgi:hypothetical protein